MPLHPAQTWYPSSSSDSIRPHPSSPFHHATTLHTLDLPLTPQETQYREICGMLKYTQDNVRKVTRDRKRYSRELKVALGRLEVLGEEGRDGRERARRVVVLGKLVRECRGYRDALGACEESLWGRERGLRRVLEGGKGNGNGGFYEGRNWWFVGGREESDGEDGEGDKEYGEYGEEEMEAIKEMDEGCEVEATEEMELECWSGEDEYLEMEIEG
ncbi:hypothetical protein EAE96_006030 [Botrytis aclada]|nr:hypothetical protein EAE96_006030 [Botrytis aclada]